MNTHDPNTHLPPGTSLHGGQFRVDVLLGHGGSGLTYRGHDLHLNRAIALKEFFPLGSQRDGMMVLPPGMHNSDYQSAKSAFLEEGRALARFHHPGIVEVYTVFEENGTAYMVMEYLQGQTLGRLLEAEGAVPQDEAVEYIAKLCEALAAMHEQGLLHQDIKPENVMRCNDGRLVLFDFGSVANVAPIDDKRTIRFTGSVRYGTPGYAPLEQYSRQAQLGTFSDVYAVAATLYHLLTGQVPVEAIDRVSGVEIEDIQMANPRVSNAVARAVMRGLRMEPGERPQTVDAFMDILRDHVRPVPARAVFGPGLSDSPRTPPFVRDREGEVRYRESRGQVESVSQFFVMILVMMLIVFGVFLIEYVRVVLK